MSGSVLAAVIVPIVVMPVLAGWLAVLYYVGDHPLWRQGSQPRGYQLGQAAPPELPGDSPGQAQPVVSRLLPH